ncbi:glutathione S-transferase C-terminal domain-containing protein, partial [Poseidonocella sp. HB161398]
VLTLEALGDAILDACLLCRYETAMRPEALRWQEWFDGQMAKIDSGLDALETRWFALLEDGFHAGSIAAACALGYLDFRFPEKDWRNGHPKLAAWFAEASERPSMKASFPRG